MPSSSINHNSATKGPMHLNLNYHSPETYMGSVVKPPNISNFNSTLGFGSLSSLQNSASPPQAIGNSRNHLVPDKHGS